MLGALQFQLKLLDITTLALAAAAHVLMCAYVHKCIIRSHTGILLGPKIKPLDAATVPSDPVLLRLLRTALL